MQVCDIFPRLSRAIKRYDQSMQYFRTFLRLVNFLSDKLSIPADGKSYKISYSNTVPCKIAVPFSFLKFPRAISMTDPRVDAT